MLLETGVARDNGILRDSGVSPGTVQSSLVRDSGVARDISVLRDSGVARIWWGSCHQTNLHGDGGCVKPSQYRCLDHVTCYNYR